MKFIYEHETTEKRLKFKDVKVNQFFVHEGCLYQKLSNYQVSQITDHEGKPFSDHTTFDFMDEIDRLIPLVNKIEY
jgi:hypothetical protein